MDSHIVDLPHDTTARPFNPDLHADPMDRVAASAPGQTAPDATRPKRRPLLLVTAAVVIVAAVGGGFLISPYNTIYPINTAKLQTQGRQVAAAIGRQATDLVSPQPTVMAPAAKIAATQAPRPPTPIKTAAVTPSSRSEQEDEIRSFHPATRMSEPVGLPVAETGHEEPSPVPAVRPLLTAPAGQQLSRSVPVEPSQIVEVGASPLQPMPNTPLATSPAASSVASTVPPLVEPAMPVLDSVASSISQESPSSRVSVPPSEVLTVFARPAPAETSVQTAPVKAVESVSTPPAPSTPGEVGSGRFATASASVPQPVQAYLVPVRRVEKPVDPVAVVALLQAAPMASPEQISVLNEVARLAIVVRDIRSENAALKARVESTADRFDEAVADFQRRLALAEAHGALNAAMGSDAVQAPVRVASSSSQATAPVPHTGRQAAPTGSRVVSATAVLPMTIAAATIRYRVTAASPGLAMLAMVDRAGGEGAHIQVATGDQVPGYGRVTAIQQRGSSWIVQTDKGPDKGVIQ